MSQIRNPKSEIRNQKAEPCAKKRTFFRSISDRLRRVIFSFLLVAPFLLRAQAQPHSPPAIQFPGGLVQLQVAQPRVDVTTPVTASAWFDPPVARLGDKIFYRVSVDATESSVEWPDQLPAPERLKLGGRATGMITEMQANSFRPLTEFVYEALPAAAGVFAITNFSVNVSGVRVEIPAASLEVVPATAALPPGVTEASRATLEISATNVFLGEPFRARVSLPLGRGNQVQFYDHEIQLNGEGLMTDKSAMRQSYSSVNVNGALALRYTCEMIVTPIAPGPLKFSAQGFASGGPAKYVLLNSDPVEINVRPLPMEGQLPGFTGAIGKFFCDPPRLSTNRLRVGEPVQLKVTFHGEGDLSRMASPVAPLSRDWQVIADPPPATSFTLIPLTDDTRETPAIPFSYFDPDTGKYVDLTIPAMPVTVVGEGLPVELAAYDESGSNAPPLKLSALAATPGKTVGSLKPLQLQGWFWALQAAPLSGFAALWWWDRRRRYLEAHPEIVRRRRARRALRREKLQLQKAVAAGDAPAYLQHAARAMNIAVAPHLPADPRALVGGDVLAQLDDAARTGQAGETVKKVFAAADAQYAASPQSSPDLPALRSGVDAVLEKLEEKL